MSETKKYSVKPSQIDANRHLWDAFGNVETEISAGYIVRMMQQRGEWTPFTEPEIEEFYRRSGHTNGFTFNRLIEPGLAFSIREGNYRTGGGWVVKKDDGTLEVTEEFVRRVHKSSPKNEA